MFSSVFIRRIFRPFSMLPSSYYSFFSIPLPWLFFPLFLHILCYPFFLFNFHSSFPPFSSWCLFSCRLHTNPLSVNVLYIHLFYFLFRYLSALISSLHMSNICLVVPSFIIFYFSFHRSTCITPLCLTHSLFFSCHPFCMSPSPYSFLPLLHPLLLLFLVPSASIPLPLPFRPTSP